jgi:hypothetical protein
MLILIGLEQIRLAMQNYRLCLYMVWTVLCILSNSTLAQNPIILDQFTADPSARVFGNNVYVYPSHDIAGVDGKGRKGWFCMEDYHVFSSSNLTHWIDHGVIVSQNKVDWVDSASYSMWAPDCIYNNGQYYFYFPSRAADTTYGKGFSIGVAVSQNPEGPYIPQPEPIKDVHGIDPNIFIDNDGQAYLYWALRKIFVAKLKDNMLELASEPKVVEALPEKGLKEGPYVFERNGIYYMTYPHVQNKTERLEYAIGDSPMGPFGVAGVIMDELPSGCWTNHHSIINFKDQWYLLYHDNDLSPKFDKNRSIRIDSLFFNEDGTIQKVIPTLRGVGITNAGQKIEIDRYSLKSDKGVSITFIDSLTTFNGWKAVLDTGDAWIQYSAVNFGSKKLKIVEVRSLSATGGTLQIRLDKTDGPLLAEIIIPKGTAWNNIAARIFKFKPGIHNLVVQLKDNKNVELDWITFK